MASTKSKLLMIRLYVESQARKNLVMVYG